MLCFPRSLPAVALTLPLLLPAALRADDWPQWRGPNRTGVSRETGLLQEWPKEGPKLLWTAKEIGFGYSTPSVAGDKLFLIDAVATDPDFTNSVTVPDGFAEASLTIPSPKGKMLYIKLRDDPSTVNTALLSSLTAQ